MTTSRKGVTLVELLVTMVILAVVSVAFTRLLVEQTRYFDRQSAAKSARNVARASLNRIAVDLRMVDPSGGVVAASADSITVRVPFVFGVVCGTSGSWTTVSLLPVDSVLYAGMGIRGYAWRGNTGAYTYTETGFATNPGTGSDCTAAGITTVTNGKIVGIQPTIAAVAAATPVFLYRTVTYKFANSAIVSGKKGLYRTVVGSSTEEVAGPFRDDAHFQFFVVNSSASQTAAPATLSDLRGVELYLYGQSERTPVGRSSAEVAQMVTAIFFKNRMT